MLKSGQLDVQRNGKRILIVDDEPRMIGFIRMNLELESHQVFEARNGLEALEVIRKQLPDLVLLDVMMPELGRLRDAAHVARIQRYPRHHADSEGRRKRQSDRAWSWARTTISPSLLARAS